MEALSFRRQKAALNTLVYNGARKSMRLLLGSCRLERDGGRISMVIVFPAKLEMTVTTLPPPNLVQVHDGSSTCHTMSCIAFGDELRGRVKHQMYVRAAWMCGGRPPLGPHEKVILSTEFWM